MRMIIPDVNVLIYAHQVDSEYHSVARDWLSHSLVGNEPVGLWDVSLTSAYRILTNPRVNRLRFEPVDVIEALNTLKSAPAAVPVTPGAYYWEVFTRLLVDADVRGGLTSDAMVAALALELHARVATFDDDFARFPGVDWFRPTLS